MTVSARTQEVSGLTAGFDVGLPGVASERGVDPADAGAVREALTASGLVATLAGEVLPPVANSLVGVAVFVSARRPQTVEEIRRADRQDSGLLVLHDRTSPDPGAIVDGYHSSTEMQRDSARLAAGPQKPLLECAGR